MKKMDFRDCVACQVVNNLLIHEEVRFNIMQRAEQYEDQANEGYQRLVFGLGGWIWLHMRKERFLILKHPKLFTSIDGPFKIIEKNVPPTFNAKYLRPYHGEDLRASLFSQLWGIDAKALTPTTRNLGLIMENLDSRGYEALET